MVFECLELRGWILSVFLRFIGLFFLKNFVLQKKKKTSPGRQIISNNIRSYLQSKIVFYLSNLHTASRTLWLSRHGESEFNRSDRIGGDSSLSDEGAEFSRRLADWIMQHAGDERPLIVWTSTLKRTIETAQAKREIERKLGMFAHASLKSVHSECESSLACFGRGLKVFFCFF